MNLKFCIKNITYLMVEIVCDLDIRVKSYGEKTKRKRWVCMHASIGRCGDWRLAGWVGPGSKLGWPGLPIAIALEEITNHRGNNKYWQTTIT